MTDFHTVINIHGILIEKYGGTRGIRDEGLLRSALARPHASFDSKELYPLPVEKAASLLQSILVNHSFLDGNKRTGYVLMRMVLLDAGIDISASQEEKYDMVIKAASGQYHFEDIVQWLRTHLIHL